MVTRYELSSTQKTLIKLPHTQMAGTDHLGVQSEHPKEDKSGLEQQNLVMRDCPSLVGGRPAKSVVERPRGFKSHIPRHFKFRLFLNLFLIIKLKLRYENGIPPRV